MEVTLYRWWIYLIKPVLQIYQQILEELSCKAVPEIYSYCVYHLTNLIPIIPKMCERRTLIEFKNSIVVTTLILITLNLDNYVQKTCLIGPVNLPWANSWPAMRKYTFPATYYIWITLFFPNVFIAVVTILIIPKSILTLGSWQSTIICGSIAN